MNMGLLSVLLAPLIAASNGYALMVLLLTYFIGVDREIAGAELIVKKNLPTPSTYHRINGRVLWSGKNKDGDPAHIVRLKYDAQNKFGANIRHCSDVAYFNRGKLVAWTMPPFDYMCEQNFSDQQVIDTLAPDFNVKVESVVHLDKE